MSDKQETSLSKHKEDGSNGSDEDVDSHNASGATNPNQVEDNCQSQSGEMKRAATRLIERYYYQLMKGCGDKQCKNANCASSGQVGPLSNNDAAVKALQLLSERAELCVSPHAKISAQLEQDLREGQKFPEEQSLFPDLLPSPDTHSEMESPSSVGASTVTSTSTTSCKSVLNSLDSNDGLSEERLKNTIEECRSSNNYARLRILLRIIFSSGSALKCSFLLPEGGVFQEENKIKGKRKSLDSEIRFLDIKKGVSKEELRSSESDLDKDVDCLEDKEMVDLERSSNGMSADISLPAKEVAPFPPTVDIESLRRSYQLLFQVPESEFSSTLMDAMRQLLRDSLIIQLKVFPQLYKQDNSIVNICIILLENPHIVSADYTDVLGDLCQVMAQLEVEKQAALVKHLCAHWEVGRVHRFLENLHQLITIRLLTTEFSREFTINDEDTITSATCVMKIIYYTSICSGELDQPLLIDLPSSDPAVSSAHFMDAGKEFLEKPPPWDSLGQHLGVHPLDVRKPAIPFEAFYDEFLSDQLEMDRDFAYFKVGTSGQFSFLSYPFILTPATKALGLYYDNRVRMYSERRMSIYQNVMEGTPANPYLSLRIRRDHIIDDALVELELVAQENPGDFKKQLVVEFEREQGIDEGGVSKEFFQLIIEQIFNPDYAMFCLNHETKTFWFNPTSFESDAQFTLVGVVLGLAIYNNVILDLHFPPVMYKKLCGKPGTFHDLEFWDTTLYNSLLDILNYEGDDMENTFMQTFRVGYYDIFGTSLHHDLRPDGNNIFVNLQNKEEFVSLYVDFLLNKSVDRQFIAFKRGFAMVTEDSPLQYLFRPHELELLVCGSQHYDFSELRKSTEYDGGYTASSPIILWFWDLVDRLGSDEKKQLLQFTTGSARVPVGGLARLKLIIARHGPDTERLPTAHTCFNVLFLPEYSSKEKLNDRLLKAIKYAQGFGLL